jgi:hypothetical protein
VAKEGQNSVACCDRHNFWCVRVRMCSKTLTETGAGNFPHNVHQAPFPRAIMAPLSIDQVCECAKIAPFKSLAR